MPPARAPRWSCSPPNGRSSAGWTSTRSAASWRAAPWSTPVTSSTRRRFAAPASHPRSVVVLATEWEEFRWLDFDKVGSVMARRAMVDARNLLDPAAIRRAGFEYEGIG